MIGLFLSLAVKKESPGFAVLVGLATGIVIFFQSYGYFSYVYHCLCQLSERSGIDNKYFSIIIKIVVIAYVTQFGCDICKDAGENSVASKVEMAGRIIIAFSCMPLIMAIMEEVIKFL
jgi:stage III sporulation protein AD